MTIVRIVNSLIIVLRDRNIMLDSMSNHNYFLFLFLLVFFIKLDKYSKYSFYSFYIIRVILLFNNYLRRKLYGQTLPGNASPCLVD